MSPIIIGILSFVVLLIMLLAGVSVSTVIGSIGILGMLILSSGKVTILKTGIEAFSTLYSYNNTVVPLFSLMAMVICHTGVGSKLYDAFYKLVGRFSGGLAIATILACGVFAAISSSSSTTALTIGLIALPEMKRARYKDTLSTGSVVAGGTLGPFIPPSSIAILYCITAQQSIITQFEAGIIPGLILIVLYCIVIKAKCFRDIEAGPKSPKFSTKEVFIAFSKCGETLVLIVVVLGGMFAGFFTPTEAASIGAAGSIIITLIRRSLTWNSFIAAVKGALRNAGMIYAMLIGSAIMNYFMAFSQLPTTIANVLVNSVIPPRLIVACMVIILMFMGMIVDSLGMLILTLPVFFPIIEGFGLSPVWFGVIMVTCVEMAVVTPPVGLNLFVTKSIDRSIPMSSIYKGAYPFFIAQIVLVILLLLFPGLTTFLPNLLAK